MLFSTESVREGTLLTYEAYFREGLAERYVLPPTYILSLERYAIILSRPLVDETGAVWGVLMGRASIADLRDIMLIRAGLGETGETYLVSANRSMLTDSRFGLTNVYVRSAAAERAIEEQRAGEDTYLGYREVPVVGVYRWQPDLQVALLAEMEETEALGIANRTVRVNVGTAGLAVVAAAGASLFIARSIGNPITDLADTVTQIAAGDLERQAKVERVGEIGTLARAFNHMTAQLRTLIGGLEAQVESRTQELARRSEYLATAAEVGRVASSILEEGQLMAEVVELIRSHLGLYYVGLFLNDAEQEWAVLRTGTGEAGKQLLERQHRLQIGGNSMVGQCILTGEGRIALDVGAEAVRFDNKLLPETRSEAAIPLRSRGRILGALSIHSAVPAAFDQETITLLQTIADQVAVALDNAALFAESQESLNLLQRLYGEAQAEGWAELVRLQGQLGYRSDYQGLTEVRTLVPEVAASLRGMEATSPEGTGHTLAPAEDADGRSLAVPVRVSGRLIGVIHAARPATEDVWSDEETHLLQVFADQLGVVLEGARLYQDTRRRAAQERLLGQVWGQMRQSLDVAAVLRAVAAELGRLPGVAEASVHVALPESQAGELAGGVAEEVHA